ncbi:MAG TPA: hypothetical protein DER01_06870 [Phycisphaerales bacterium]|nr:hypothetical protein [Phycisphaerales bacterium]|tara:strand:+ start:17708 stop:18409 length:702 start_codon:yes stop_codon:yes gene_type:complete
MPPIVPVFFGIILFFFVILGIYGYIAHDKYKIKSRELKAFADQLGYQYVKKNSGSDNLACYPASIFHIGHPRIATNLIKGNRDGLDVLLMDYRYDVGETDTELTLAAYKLPETGTPTFTMDHKFFLGKLFDKVIRKNVVHFHEHPDFSKSWLVKSENEVAVRQWLTPALIQLIEAGMVHQDWHVDVAEGWLVIYTKRELVKTEMWQTFFDNTFIVAEKFFHSAKPFEMSCADV